MCRGGAARIAYTGCSEHKEQGIRLKRAVPEAIRLRPSWRAPDGRSRRP